MSDEDIRKIARRLCDEIGTEKDYSGPNGALDYQRDIDRVTAKLLQIWNARGAADAQAVEDRIKQPRCVARDLRDAIKALDR